MAIEKHVIHAHLGVRLRGFEGDREGEAPIAASGAERTETENVSASFVAYRHEGRYDWASDSIP
jgi:hypothetical protein